MTESSGSSRSDLLEPQSSETASTAMTLYEHMDELRSRLLKVAIAVIICMLIAYCFIDPILAFVLRPVGEVVFTAPSDAFLAQIVLAFLTGCLVSLPIILFHIWRFVSLGLKPQEAHHIKVYGPASLLLFVVGALFAYFVIVPIAIDFLLGFGSATIKPMITIKNYVSFVGTLVLAFGVVFELPLILLFLAHIGVATPAFLEQKRRYAIVLILIVSALITPPDFVTQLMMGVPLIVLYEIGIVCIKLKNRKK